MDMLDGFLSNLLFYIIYNIVFILFILLFYLFRIIYKLNIIMNDIYTVSILKQRFDEYKNYVYSINHYEHSLNIRKPIFPEDISENIIKFIIHNVLGDKTSSWYCNTGDLYSSIEGIQECKCFTSNAPISFSPSSKWDVIYFLDARNWLSDYFILYKANISNNNIVWSNIKINQNETFKNHSDMKRRPRISWRLLYPQIHKYCSIVYQGSFEDIFIR